MADFIGAIKVTELPAGTKKAVTIAGKRIMIVNADGHYFALADACSHHGCPLSEEGTVEAGTITCNCHGSQFDLSTGDVLAPPATTPQPIYKVKVEGDTVLVAV